MKKILILLAFVFIVSIGLNSCRTSKPPCPAYQASTIEHVDFQNYTK